MKVLYVPCYHCKDVLPVLEKRASILSGFKRIGVVSTAQHLNQLDAVRNFLESKGWKVYIGGQVLGCNQENAVAIESKIDAYLYIGSGLFHPAGIAVKTSKPVILLNPYAQTMGLLSPTERELWLRRQKGRLAKALSAGSYGILVSAKTGQFNLAKAKRLKKKLESQGKKAFLFAGEELNPSNLLPFKVDCWINTACPRLADDHFEKTVINAEELELI
jgi:2-(3-amino-3-carboxypropyl)histidine synthase